ncbi:MauE/DoxX family redox-associated membrane protein [Nocardia sp. NPDC051321]|uniref:MauE/DoxX family redox-associated membrane protein n=1 Tax=Nocardia sp. NPDC051321 TaxID=3364323 RepID=UPI0037952DB3
MDMVVLIGRVFLMVTIGGAGVSKIGDRLRFTEAIMEYRVVPVGMAIILGRWLPVAEIAAAALLAAGIATAAGALFVAVCMIAFAIAMALNLIRGRRIECGCSASSSLRVSWLLVGRNLLLAVVAGLLVADALRADVTGMQMVIAVPSGVGGVEVAVVLITCIGLLGLALVRRALQLRSLIAYLHLPTNQRESR